MVWGIDASGHEPVSGSGWRERAGMQPGTQVALLFTEQVTSLL